MHMAKKKEDLKPLFPLKHEFYASLDKFIHEACMLMDTVDQLLKMEKITGPTASILSERVKAFNKIRFGNDD